MKVGLDTNIFMAIQNKKPESPSCEKILITIDKNAWQCWVSVITIAEMMGGYFNQKNFSQADQFLLLIQRRYQIQPISIAIAQLGARYRSDFKLSLPNALILASCAVNKVDYLISDEIFMQKKFPIQVTSVANFVDNYLGC